LEGLGFVGREENFAEGKKRTERMRASEREKRKGEREMRLTGWGYI